MSRGKALARAEINIFFLAERKEACERVKTERMRKEAERVKEKPTIFSIKYLLYDKHNFVI